MKEIFAPNEPLFFIVGRRFYSEMEPIGVNTIEEAIATAYWGRDYNSFYPTGVINISGETILNETQLDAALCEYLEKYDLGGN